MTYKSMRQWTMIAHGMDIEDQHEDHSYVEMHMLWLSMDKSIWMSIPMLMSTMKIHIH